MKTRDYFIVAAIMVAVLVVWNYGDDVLRTTGRFLAGGYAAAATAPDPAPAPITVVVPNTTSGDAPEADAPAVATSDGEFIAGESRTVNGPAIVQLWDGKTVTGCGIYQVPAGYRLTWALRGHYWLFEGVNEDAFNEAFDASQAAFAASSPQCAMKAPPLK